MLSWEMQSSRWPNPFIHLMLVTSPSQQTWVCAMGARVRKEKATRSTVPSCETTVLGRLGRERKKGRESKGKRNHLEKVWLHLPPDFAEICSLLTILTTKSNSHPCLYLNALGTFPLSSQSCPIQSSLHLAPAVCILELMLFQGWTKADTAHGISST